MPPDTENAPTRSGIDALRGIWHRYQVANTLVCGVGPWQKIILLLSTGPGSFYASAV